MWFSNRFAAMLVFAHISDHSSNVTVRICVFLLTANFHFSQTVLRPLAATSHTHTCMSVPARANCAGLPAVSESNNILLISQVSLAIKCTKLTLHGTPLGTLFPPHKCFSYCPFVPLQNGVDACETERDTGGPRVHYSPLFSRGE